MSYLIDTNIISEVRKGMRCDAHVAAWYEAISDDDLFLSVLVLGEIRKGVERIRPHDAAKAVALEHWLQDVETAFDGRILPVDIAVSEQWGRWSALRSISVIDGLLAATASVHHLTLATRNSRDVEGLGVNVINPFKPSAL